MTLSSPWGAPTIAVRRAPALIYDWLPADKPSQVLRSAADGVRRPLAVERAWLINQNSRPAIA